MHLFRYFLTNLEFKNILQFSSIHFNTKLYLRLKKKIEKGKIIKIEM